MPLSRPARALALSLLAALLAALVPAGAAHAESRTVQGGRLDWGIKTSFQSYVTGPIAQGTWGLTGGAATVGGSQFRFHSAQGSYDPATGAFDAAFSGGVRFTGHRTADGTHELDLTISRPRVRIKGGSGTLYADMASKAKDGGRTTVTSQVPLATLDLGGVDMRGGGSPLSLAGVPATLTAQGATAFAGYYPAGTPLDPVALTVDVRSSSTAASGTAPTAANAGPATTPPTGTSPTAQPTGTPSRTAFHAAAVDWGVRRTFREYVTGPLSQGRWTLADGAQDGGALFRFPSGTGTYDPAKGTLDAAFTGSVRFTGAHLDLTLGKVTVKVSGGSGTLGADVTSAGKTDRAVPLVTFTARDLTPENGLAAVTEAPATLTEGGAKAFGGMYKAGTAMDPVSLAVAVDATARLPALPDLGSGAGAVQGATSVTPRPTSAAPAAASSAASDSSTPPTGTYLAIGAGVLLVAVLAVLAAVRRRRTGTPTA
ncbi:Htaa domain protein [Streptomyces venezuelae]|uniref:HtaA domain-containing protein n=1 Tax=Streptomyces venezuelae TaxID=54571 RepID=UPI00123C88CF|nr:HtaA domain-containing protein [Streptomyces venezuelae]QES15448.1 Htaa domain protein [Streptomyces venezuelae]